MDWREALGRRGDSEAVLRGHWIDILGRRADVGVYQESGTWPSIGGAEGACISGRPEFM